MALEAQVLKRVVPSPEEEARLRATVEDVKRRVSAGIRARGLDAEPLLVGSVAKGTHLSEAEIDLFVAFPRTVPREALEREGLALGAFLEDKLRMYAEHPYTRGRWNGFEVEVVPCYRIADASEKMSAVDRTPLHAAYVIAKLGPAQRDEGRLPRAVEEACRRAEFRVAGSRFAVVDGQVLLLYEFEVFALPAVEKHRGPPVWMKNAEDFLRRWRRAKDAMGAPRIEGDRWVVDVRRAATDAAALVRKGLPRMSLGSHLDRAVRRARVLRDAQLFRKAYLPEVTRLLDPRFPWE